MSASRNPGNASFMHTHIDTSKGHTESIYHEALAWLDNAIQRVDELIAPAQLVAQRILQGGRMYVMGSHGLVCELTGRAGGLAGLGQWTVERLTDKDVVLAGQLLPDEMGGPIGDLAAIARRDTRLTPALTIYIAGGSWLLTQRLVASFRVGWQQYVMLDTHVGSGRDLTSLSLGQMAGVATAWALVGEIYSAVARGGRAMATYGSLLEPGGPEWLAKYSGQLFNDDITVVPAAPGEYARAYLCTCRRQIAAFLASDQPGRVRLAASRLAEALAAGHMAMVLVAGHLLAEHHLIPGQLDRMILLGRDFEWRRPCILQDGDFLVYVAYLDYPRETIERAMAMGANVITFTAEPNGPTNDRQTHICGHWQRWDSVVEAQGSPYKILPTSGVVQTPQWFSFIAELMGRRP
jgi:hypothetical protein